MDKYKQKAILEIIEWAAGQGIALPYDNAEQILDIQIERLENRFLYGEHPQQQPPRGILGA